MKKIIFIQIFFLFISCNKQEDINNSNCEKYNFDHFELCIPDTWKQEKVVTYDSKVILFVNKNDSILISNGDIDISDNPIIVNNQKEKKELLEFSNNEISPNDIKIYKNKDFDTSKAVYHKNYYYYDKVNEIEVLFVFPKKKIGTVGAFFNKDSETNKLTIYCNNPSEETKNELVKLFNRVKFVNPK